MYMYKAPLLADSHSVLLQFYPTNQPDDDNKDVSSRPRRVEFTASKVIRGDTFSSVGRRIRELDNRGMTQQSQRPQTNPSGKSFLKTFPKTFK